MESVNITSVMHSTQGNSFGERSKSNSQLEVELYESQEDFARYRIQLSEPVQWFKSVDIVTLAPVNSSQIYHFYSHF